MGSSINPLDYIGQQRVTNLNPLDNLQGNPLDKLQLPKPPETWATGLGNFAKTLFENSIFNFSGYKDLGNAFSIGKQYSQGVGQALNHPIDTFVGGLKQVQGIKNTLDDKTIQLMSDSNDAINYWFHTPISQSVKDAGQYLTQAAPIISDVYKNGVAKSGQAGLDMIASLPSSLIHMAEQVPQSITGTKVIDGQVIGLSPQEQEQVLQEATGNVAMFFTGDWFGKGVVGESVANVAKTMPGKIGQMVKTVGNNALEGMAAGAVGGGIASFGNEDALAVTSQYVLAGGALGSVLKTSFDYLNYAKPALENGTNIPSQTQARISELAGLNEARVSLNDTPASILAKTEAFATSDNMFETAVKSNLITKSGMIVEGLSPDKINEFAGRETPYNLITSKTSPVSLIIPKNSILDPVALSSFNKTGFLPKEVVSFQGKDHLVLGLRQDGMLSLTSGAGDVKYVQPNEVLRVPSQDLSPYVVKFGDKLKGQTMPVLTNDKIVNSLYSDFREIYDLKSSKPQLTYDATIARFLKSKRLDQSLQKPLADAFVSKIKEDVMNLAKDEQPDEVYKINQLQKSASDYVQKMTQDQVVRVSSMIHQNDMALTTDGGGVYRLEFNDGSHVGTVGSLSDVEGMIRQAKQGKFIDLDGGNTNGIPTSASNNGGLLSKYEQPLNRSESALAGLRKSDVPFIGSWGTGALREAAAIDASYGYSGKFYSAFDNLNKAKNAVGYYTNTVLKKAYNFASQMGDIQRKFASGRMSIVADDIEAISIQDLKSGLYGRPINNTELGEATRLAGDVSGIGVVRRLLSYAAKNSNDLVEGAKEAASAGLKFNDKDIMAVQSLQSHFKDGIDNYSPAMVLLAAERLKDPSLDISRAEHQAKYKLTPQEIRLVDLNDKLYQEAAQHFGIEKGRQIQRYMPHLRILDQIGYTGDSGLPADFVSELKNYGMLDRDTTNRNPTEVAYKYLKAGANKFGGLTDAIGEANKVVNNLQSDKAGATNSYDLQQSSGASKARYEEYRDKIIRGFPTNEERLMKAGRTVADKLYGSAGTYMMDVLNLSLQGGPLVGLTARDAMTWMGFALSNLDSKTFSDALLKVFHRDGFSNELAETAKRNGLLTNDIVMQMVDPNAGDSALRQKTINKITDRSFKMTGQPFFYERASVATYLAKRNQVINILTKLKEGKLTKEKAYSILDVDGEDYAFRQHFDDLVQGPNGIEQAANDFGRLMSRKLVNHFGRINNPIAWRSSTGRWLGNYGSWTQNATGTVQDMMANGPMWKRSYKLAKLAAFSGTLVAVGGVAGLDLVNAIYNPLQGLIKGSPLFGLLNDISKAATNLPSYDQDKRAAALEAMSQLLPPTSSDAAKFTRIYIPYSRQLDALINSYRIMDQGSTWIQGAWKAVGGNVIQR